MTTKKPIKLYDSTGRTISTSGFVKSAKRSYSQPYTAPANKDWSQLMPVHDFNNLLTTSRSLYENNGIVRGTIDFLAQRAVGRGYTPQFQGIDKEWGIAAVNWLNTWFSIGDVRATPFREGLILDSISLSRDGGAYCLKTRSKSGYPMTQSIPAHRIGSRQTTPNTLGKNTINNGIVQNPFGRTIGYIILGASEDGSDDQFVSASSLISMENIKSYDQNRGLPIFSFALNTLKQLMTSNEYELQAQMIMSSMALQVHNEDGEPDPDSMYSGGNTTAGVNPGVEVQSVQGGTINYFQSDAGGKLETLTNDRPSQNWQTYHARLNTAVLAGVDIPSTVILEAAGNGTATRLAIGKAEKAIEVRQDKLDAFARAKVVYALSVAIEKGDLPPNPDWTRWTFSHPKRLSIDLGRDSTALINEYNVGLKTKTQILAEQNIALEDHIRENLMDEIKTIKIREELEKQYGVKIDPRSIRLLTPNETPDSNDE